MAQHVVRNYRNEVVGYRCKVCLNAFDAMWDDTCNTCEDKERKHKELVKAIEKQKIVHCETCKCGKHNNQNE